MLKKNLLELFMLEYILEIPYELGTEQIYW